MIENRKGTDLAKRFQSSSKQQQCLEYITAYAKKYNIDFCYNAIIDPAEALTQMEIDYDMAQNLRLPNIPCTVIDDPYLLPGICEQKSYFPFFTLMLDPSFDGAEA